MEGLTLAIVFRAVERILVVATGALSIYLGYRLFLSMPKGEPGSGKLELPGGISIYLSRVGPGVFFALFGAVVIALSFHYRIYYSDVTGTEGSASPTPSVSMNSDTPGGPNKADAVVATTTHSYSALSPAAQTDDPLLPEAQRSSVLLVIRNLNRFASLLREDISPRDRFDIEQAVAEAKLNLLATVWDRDRWGKFATMRDWIQRGESDPPPAAIGDAVTHYRAGSEMP